MHIIIYPPTYHSCELVYKHTHSYDAHNPCSYNTHGRLLISPDLNSSRLHTPIPFTTHCPPTGAHLRSLPLWGEGQLLGEEQRRLVGREVRVLKQRVVSDALSAQLLVVLRGQPGAQLLIGRLRTQDREGRWTSS